MFATVITYFIYDLKFKSTFKALTENSRITKQPVIIIEIILKSVKMAALNTL